MQLASRATPGPSSTVPLAPSSCAQRSAAPALCAKRRPWSSSRLRGAWGSCGGGGWVGGWVGELMVVDGVVGGRWLVVGWLVDGWLVVGDGDG